MIVLFSMVAMVTARSRDFFLPTYSFVPRPHPQLTYRESVVCDKPAVLRLCLSQHVPNSGQRIESLVHFKSRGCPGYSHGELVVAIGSRVSRKAVNALGRGPAYQDSGKSHIAWKVWSGGETNLPTLVLEQFRPSNTKSY